MADPFVSSMSCFDSFVNISFPGDTIREDDAKLRKFYRLDVDVYQCCVSGGRLYEDLRLF